MQSPHFQNFNFYQQNYESSNNQPRSNFARHNPPHYNQNRKPMNPNYNEEHWCETCDRSFPSLDLLDRHKQQHQKCNIDGCQFIAHPKVITKHIQMQHSSGLYHKIAKLNNPEEIQKWRDERKRKYPTKVNIDKKAAEMKEKIERGEKMGLNQNRHKKPDRIVNGANKTSGRNHQRNQRKTPYPSTFMLTKKSTVPKKVHQVLPTADSLRVLKPFAGIQDIIMEDTPEEIVEEEKCDFIIEDDDMLKLTEPEKDPQKLLNDKEPKVCGALSSLMCTYESSDDEMDDNKDHKSKTDENSTVSKMGINDSKTDENATVSNRGITNDSMTDKQIDSIGTKSNDPETVKDNKSDDDSGPEEIGIDKIKEISTFEEQPKVVKTLKVKQTFTEKNRNRQNFIKPKHKVPSTLLQKLLRREVQQERNIVLQCIRHIVKNNYFDKSSLV